MKKWVFIFSSLLLVDILTKVWAMNWIPYLESGPYPFGGIGVFSLGGITFSLNYVVNTGAAWGIFAGNAALLFAIRLLIILGLFIFMPKRLPIWLIITGAVGNVIDFCLYRHVIDFLYFTFWRYSFPVFNIADSCITIGILCLLILPKRAVKTV